MTGSEGNPSPGLSWESSSFTEGRGLGPAEGVGKGVRWGTCFSHRNPVAGDPSVRGQWGRRQSQ